MPPGCSLWPQVALVLRNTNKAGVFLESKLEKGVTEVQPGSNHQRRGAVIMQTVDSANES
eukprot:230217-Amphidinium_carterae.2